MIDGLSPQIVAVFVIGAVILLASLCRVVLRRAGLPELIGYILIGVALSFANREFDLLSPGAREGLHVLAASGIVILLFRVGLESNFAKLLEQLPRASVALIGSVVPAAICGYLTVRHLFGGGVVPALFVAVAFTATSVGVAVAIWRELGLIDSDDGALLIDLAELDDIAGVILVAILLAVAPLLLLDNGIAVELAVFADAGWLVLKLALLVLLCFLFAHYLERRVTRWFARAEADPVPIVPIAATGFLIAALAGWFGFSLAIGALFAGLAFSRDPDKVKFDTAFETLSRFFVPFFFVGIGLEVDTSLLGAALGMGAILLAVAAATKILGTALPIALTSGGASALVIGVSMVPRAEIAMVVMERGRNLGDWAVSAEIYGAMVFMALGSCLLTPPLLRLLLRRRAPGDGAG